MQTNFALAPRLPYMGQFVQQQERSPKHNIYLGMPCPLLARYDLNTSLAGVDPVFENALARVESFLEKTFWAIPAAFEFGKACQALAKRGHNIDALTLYWGPGGVGLSLYTAHLAAMYGERSHKFFDPNIFYHDEELRKQVEQLWGGIIFTGQEKPTGTRSRIREDLIKKFATAEVPTRIDSKVLVSFHNLLL